MPPVDRYAVIGHPIAHSRSPWIHAQFAAATGQALSYGAIDVPPERLVAQVREFFAGGGRGLNVTVPHKQAVLALMHDLSDRARIAGAVNTIARTDRGELLGENTDGVGFVRDVTRNLGVPITGRRVLLLGAGGAARGLTGPLLGERPRELVIANRTAARALDLAARFAADAPVRASAYAELAGPPFDLVINATAASLQQQLPPLPAGIVAAGTLCYDLAYGHAATRFVEWARAQGAGRACMGGGMLVEQAAEAFLLWRGVRPDTAAVLAELAG